MKINVSLDGHELVLKFPFSKEINQRIKKVFGWRFDGQTKTWRVHAASVDDLIDEFGALLKFDTSYDEIKAAIESIGPMLGSIDATIVDYFKISPYDYQVVAGTAFLPVAKKCILADEVGVGKTLSSLVGFASLYKKGIVNKALVICKASLKSQWLSEIYKFTDFEGIVIEGTTKKRQELYELAKSDDYQFVIVNYDLLRYEGKRAKKKENKFDDLKYVLEVVKDCQIIIADEVHKIKNSKTKTRKGVLQLDAPYKWGLTGTPIENKPEDLYNIMFWINPEVFGRNPMPFKHRYYFYEYGHPVGIKTHMLPDLRARIAPHMLRRYKRDISSNFPDFSMDYVYIDMDDLQAEIHELIRTNSLNLLMATEGDEDEEITEKGSAFGNFMLLLQVANTPELLAYSESKYGQEIYNKKVKGKGLSVPKIDWVYDLLEERNDLNPEAKTLIFTRSDDMAELIKKRLLKLFKEEEVLIYKGKLSNKQRDSIINGFKENGKVMICTEAGAEGLNLQVADLEINIDLPFNPSRLTQRIGRIDRAGSEFDKIKVLNLISKDSVDERILDLIYQKQGLIDAVIEGNVVDMKLTRGLLQKLLKAKST